MKQPKHILETGTRVVTVALKSAYRELDSPHRRSGRVAHVHEVAGGMGGDVYVLKHNDDDSLARYCFDEFEYA